MSHNADEVAYLLDRAASLDAAARALSVALEAPCHEPRFTLKGIVYEASGNKPGFTVALHGVTLLPVYEHVLDRSGDSPDLFARIQLCLPGDGTKPGKVLISLLVADTGDYSDDGTSSLAYSTYDPTGRPSDLCRYRLSLAIAEAVQASLPVLSPTDASARPAKDDALRVA
ncbi:hypothetical protein [Paraburkholderia tuberum]|uniref:Uncharacterized protein n=1 Tax=Paraburkholderia tuberum TaxID=157910 RepID=A0A1H1HBZ5_9BURK|nr:hypothetical protein [Paraburkholderia tuberum]SDR22891.1 hypothetical protein SAMN05445850_3432 [Paraburkholderia tuberum]